MNYKDTPIKDYLDENFDMDILDAFFMLIDSIESTIDISINNLSDSPDLINDLFRMFHNLKSAADFLHIDRIKYFAHLVESVLEKLREDPSKINDKVIEWLTKVSEMFHIWYEDIEENQILSPLDPKILKIPIKV